MAGDPAVRASIEFLPLSTETLAALAEADLGRAGELLGRSLPPAVDDDRWLWKLRNEQVAGRPADLSWIVRLLSDVETGQVVGHAGFHQAPVDGVVEVAYTVFPDFRGRGYARAALAALIREARERGVITLRATVSPENEASHRVLAGFGFEVAGEQRDDEDGLEIIHDLDLRKVE